ncbi:hypothetical protein [Sphingomonas nostoxanthinifaciens]|uniref:hypothetical protein n=1 Tax=Sphingomonas nostoxanthinifaciens TaxID=2872652 RepID=UPI001CC20BCC|nr:hypothetical protein [Sphingomonas nostoxanthinifaciens]UAK25887.1 hypothetical protein K8P63_07135 [Sphingomonas nostoxanthinifaciens]
MTDHRCRLCTANDREAVIEKLAADMWCSRIDIPWDEAGIMWQKAFRQMAEAAVRSLQQIG